MISKARGFLNLTLITFQLFQVKLFTSHFISLLINICVAYLSYHPPFCEVSHIVPVVNMQPLLSSFLRNLFIDELVSLSICQSVNFITDSFRLFVFWVLGKFYQISNFLGLFFFLVLKGGVSVHFIVSLFWQLSVSSVCHIHQLFLLVVSFEFCRSYFLIYSSETKQASHVFSWKQKMLVMGVIHLA